MGLDGPMGEISVRLLLGRIRILTEKQRTDRQKPINTTRAGGKAELVDYQLSTTSASFDWLFLFCFLLLLRGVSSPFPERLADRKEKRKEWTFERPACRHISLQEQTTSRGIARFVGIA